MRNKLAYREEVRAEIMENMLDDRHDIKGNTLYRLKFDSTLIPHKDSNLWALVIIRLKGNNTSPEVALSTQDNYAPTETPEDTLYRDWYEYTQKELNNELSARTQSLWGGKIKQGELLKFSSFLHKEADPRVPEVSPKVNCPIKNNITHESVLEESNTTLYSSTLDDFAKFTLEKFGKKGFEFFLAPNLNSDDSQKLRLQISSFFHQRASGNLKEKHESWHKLLEDTEGEIKKYLDKCENIADMIEKIDSSSKNNLTENDKQTNLKRNYSA